MIGVITMAFGAMLLVNGEVCQSPQGVLDEIQTVRPTAKVVKELSGDAAVGFMEKWNALPPVTTSQADLVQVITRPNYPFPLLLLFNNGCLQSSFRLNLRFFHLLFPPSLDVET